MNYQKIYDDICKRGQERQLPKEVYTEKHHIVPKCLGGGNEKSNLTVLTAREHFICHWILAEKLYPKNGKLWFSFWRMCGPGNPYQERIMPPSKLYEETKKFISVLKSEQFSGENNPMFGKKHDDETRKKLSDKRKLRIGKLAPNFGKKFAEEWCKKLGKNQQGTLNNFYGKTHSDETKRLMRERALERTVNKKRLIDEQGIIYDSRKDFMQRTGLSEYKMNKLFKENKLKDVCQD